MSDIDIQKILNKFNFMRRYLNELEKFRLVSWKDYENSFETQLIVERLIQLIVQVGIDINFYILKQLNLEQPDNGADSILELSRLGIIEGELAFRLSESIRMRNLLVHLYEKIDPQIVHSSIEEIFQDYLQYQSQITEYIDTLNTEDKSSKND
jgi:uncharacterized protein YutE (UPF0331/DUF86 family)